MSKILLDGRFVEADAAAVSAFDAGFQHGVGLFETMLGVVAGEGPQIIGLRDHAERLAESARALGLSDDLRIDPLCDACLAAFEESGLERSRIRLTITGGDLNMLGRARQPTARDRHTPTVMVHAQPATEYPLELFERGVAVTVAGAKANPLDPTAAHKTLNYWWRLRELQMASSGGGAEALVFQVSNHLAGGCVSNAILVKDDRAYTPIARGEEQSGAIPSPVLPGVTRAMALGWCEDLGLEVSRQMLTITDVLQADEVLLTNSSFGVLPVSRIEAEAVGGGAVGRVGRELAARWRETAGLA